MYFKKFPRMLYDFEFDQTQQQNNERQAKRVIDITANVRFRRDLLANITLYDYYDMKEGETPEIVAEKAYGNSQYHWIIMLANERYDYRADFPLEYSALQSMIEAKYTEPDGIKHYVDANNVVVPSTTAGAQSVSNRQWEEAENEKKRRIKLPAPNVINKILKDFRDEM